MRTALLAWWLLAPAWRPASAPPPTVWARAGATGWAVCDELARQAAALRNGVGVRGAEDDPSPWTERAARCPAVPEILFLAAQFEIIAAGDLGLGPEPGVGLGPVIEDHRRRVTQALRWLERSIDESARRREAAPREARFLRAYALLALGRHAEARVALDDAVAHCDVERWRSDRMGAVIALVAGDIEAAMELAHRASEGTPSEDRTITRYIRALVLDRSGAPAASRAELMELRNDAGHILSRIATESLLPIHERVYLRALERQIGDDPGSAIPLWDAYLTRPEVDEPDRVLARRHRAALVRTPAPVR